MDYLPPTSHSQSSADSRPPSSAQAMSCPPTPANGPPSLTNPPTQSPLQAPDTPPSQSPNTQQQPQNVIPQFSIAQANNSNGSNTAQSAFAKPVPRIWSWLRGFSQFCAALLTSGSIIIFIYYQIRADQRDDRNFEYAVHSWNLSVWTAHKDYCDFQLSHDNNTTAESCSVGPPPAKLAYIKLWMRENIDAVLTDAERAHVVNRFLLAAGLVVTLRTLYNWCIIASFHLFKRLHSHNRFEEAKKKDVHVDRVLEEFLRDTIIDLLLSDSCIAELGEMAISRLSRTVGFQESLLDLLNTYYVDLSDEFLGISSTLGKTHGEGRNRSHEIFSTIAPCWIYEVKKSRTYIAEKVVKGMTAYKGLTEPRILPARTEHLIHRTQHEWRHEHDMCQVEGQVSLVIRLLTEGTASSRLKEGFRNTLVPAPRTLNVKGIQAAVLAGLEQKLAHLDKRFTDSANILTIRLNLGSNELSIHAHDLNLKTNFISHEVHKLNRLSTVAAIANVKAAEKTSLTTSVNVLLLWITAPVTLVLQYFGSEQAVFSFERNPRTFIIALVVVFATLPLLTYALYSFELGEKAFWEFLGLRRGRKTRHEDEPDALELNMLDHVPFGAA
ncbi:hypothetical protein FB567DRAFT_534429 [Paraphoma chrysanthemicola]|uniref:Uncharacterized protein n=1 Tax=Paraphoma chrysanthemicola TaxID=798071 RepID=A0A8K0VUX5_9PLEO|nr:hypothetical protein FB567DRAFT_534429 [Paraphoma chrysanthemicola]